MTDSLEIYRTIAESRHNTRSVAELLGLTLRQFEDKADGKTEFLSGEIALLTCLFDFRDPDDVFFAQSVDAKSTRRRKPKSPRPLPSPAGKGDRVSGG